MFQLLWLVVAIPFVSAVLLALFGSRLPRKFVAISGAGSIGVAAALTLLIGAEFVTSPPAGNAYVQHLWTWMNSDGFQPEVALYLDSVALLMLLVVTFVGFLIHLYSVEYMRDDEGYARFFRSDGFQPEVALYLDSVALLMLLVVTFVGFLIHLYSVEYMRDDEGYARFF